jgi:hypothetical protein
MKIKPVIRGRWMIWNNFEIWFEATDTIPKPIKYKIMSKFSPINSNNIWFNLDNKDKYKIRK